ncbi:MAG TPA: glycosyl hydrolase 53 family protein [Methylomirabilota bacterium]|nr:glycosyl hydrolase 53 family protein [Methylomirabilota bacterium]
MRWALARWLLAALAVAPRSAAGDDEFIAGADMSHLVFFEDRGVVYRESGRGRDALLLLKERGLNCVRLRLFTSDAQQAAANPYNSANNLDYTLPLAVRVKRAGLQLLLDFHYSDSWADPGKQTKPAAWTNLTFAQLEQRMYEYNSNTIAAFQAAGALPDIVQVGNEVIGGVLWPEGRVGGAFETPAQWSQFGRLLKAAIRGIKDAAAGSSPRIMIHIDRGGDWSGTQWFFDRLQQQQVEFDLIGLSYYPWWHGSLNALRTCLRNAAQRYSRPIVVAETAFPWTNAADIFGIPATPAGQVEFVIEVAKILKSLPGRRGAGLVWWGTEYQWVPGVALAGFDQRSFFDRSGEILPVASAVGQLTAPVRLHARWEGGTLELNWPLSGAGWSLVSVTHLGAVDGWLRVTNAVEEGLEGFKVRVPDRADQSRFFRLRAD